MPSCVTDGVRVTVESFPLEARTDPRRGRWAFGYRVTISNGSTRPVRLLRRHWTITDAEARVTEVHGDGVVGEQPRLEPGDEYTYSSWAMLEAPHGLMEGSYDMEDGAGKVFSVGIPAFRLGTPRMLH